jgi:flagellar basal-body rod protein FlgB
MFEDLTLMAMARKSMDWLSRRQEVLSENIANANTPKYQARDIKPLDFSKVLQAEQQPVQAAVTNPMHIAVPVQSVKYDPQPEKSPDESKPDGNSVLLEEQMEKVGDVKAKYQLAVNLLQKNVKMIETAIGKSS